MNKYYKSGVFFILLHFDHKFRMIVSSTSIDMISINDQSFKMEVNYNDKHYTKIEQSEWEMQYNTTLSKLQSWQ